MSVLLIVLFIVFGGITMVLFVVFAVTTMGPKGKRGEETVASMLEKLKEQYGGYIINDVILPTRNSTTQIDHIYFSTKGIFVIETKNYSGRIYGNENQTYWTQVLAYGETKNKLYNPVKQNDSHVGVLLKTLRTDIDVISMVIFVQGNTRFIKSRDVFTLFEARNYILGCKSIYSDQEIYDCYLKIIEYKNNPVATSEDHIRNVRNKYQR